MLSHQEYSDILSQHGRRVANRVLYASTPVEIRAERGLAGFYRDNDAMYGDEAKLPGNERCTTGMIDKFHPYTLQSHYPDASIGCDTDNECVNDFAALPAEWRAFVHCYLFVWTDEQKEDALLKELEACPENEPFLTALYEISATDKYAIRCVINHLTGKMKWPDPETPEAEERIAMRAEVKRESQRQTAEEQG